MGFVFQFHHLLPEFSAIENVAMPALISGKGKSEAMAQAMDLLKKLNIHARAEHKPHQMSGGEQQRVAIARAFASDAPILFADEPTGNLDTRTGATIIELLFELNQEQDRTLVLVTHEQRLADRCGRILELSAGQLVSDTRS